MWWGEHAACIRFYLFFGALSMSVKLCSIVAPRDERQAGLSGAAVRRIARIAIGRAANVLREEIGSRNAACY